jgi:hypothetical protein
MKIKRTRLISVITEQLVLQEYYRDFESRIRKFGFDSLEQAVETLLGYPEFQELFVAPGKKITSKEVMNDSTHLATLDYLMDKMEQFQAEFSPSEKPSEEDIQALADEVETEPEPTPQDIKQDAAEAEEESDGLKLTKVPERDIKGALLQLGNKGVKADAIRNAVKVAIEKMIKDAAMAPNIARKIADHDAPLLLKIGDEMARILAGDFSNLKETKRKRRRK